MIAKSKVVCGETLGTRPAWHTVVSPAFKREHTGTKVQQVAVVAEHEDMRLHDDPMLPRADKSCLSLIGQNVRKMRRVSGLDFKPQFILTAPCELSDLP